MTREAAPPASSRGETLLEVLITVMVVGVGVVGVLFGILAAASGSTASQSYADVRETLAAASARIQAAAYQPASASGSCDTAPASAYTAALSGITAPKNIDGSNAAAKPTVLRIDYWTGSGFLSGSSTYLDPDGSGTVPGCFYDRNSGASHMQRITLQRGTEKLTIVKRQP
jgi:Tfp pilus assembly protein PilV